MTQRAVILLRVNDRALPARHRFREMAKHLQEQMGIPVLAAYAVSQANMYGSERGTPSLTLARAAGQLVADGVTEIAVIPYMV